MNYNYDQNKALLKECQDEKFDEERIKQVKLYNLQWCQKYLGNPQFWQIQYNDLMSYYQTNKKNDQNNNKTQISKFNINYNENLNNSNNNQSQISKPIINYDEKFNNINSNKSQISKPIINYDQKSNNILWSESTITSMKQYNILPKSITMIKAAISLMNKENISCKLINSLIKYGQQYCNLNDYKSKTFVDLLTSSSFSKNIKILDHQKITNYMKFKLFDHVISSLENYGTDKCVIISNDQTMVLIHIDHRYRFHFLIVQKMN